MNINTLKTTFFLAILAVLFVSVGQMLGGRSGATMALIMAGPLNVTG